MKRKTKSRLIALAVLAGILLIALLCYLFVLKNLTIPAGKVIKCGQESVWSTVTNSSELVYTQENEYIRSVEIDGGIANGYCLPVGSYGLVSFGTANIYIYEALTFDGVTDYYQTWIINFYSGSEVIQKNVYSAPGVFESAYVQNYIEISEPDNLVIVNGSAEFYIDPES